MVAKAASRSSGRGRRTSGPSRRAPRSDAGVYYDRFMARAVKACTLREESTRFGNTEPRIHTKPLRALTPKTSMGYSVIEFAHDVVGIELLPWQQALLIRALELRKDAARFRFRTLVLLVGRQNGKSTVVQVLTLWAMYVLGVRLVIGTAQDLDIAETLWGEVVEIVESVEELDALKLNVVRVNGKKSLDLRTGEKYKVRAANRRGGRGLSGDLIVLDELREHTNWDAWGAITKTTMARPRAQVWCMSNAGDDSSVVLMTLRKKAHLALGDPDGICTDEAVGEADESLGIFEWSTSPGRGVWDRDGWQEANPSLGRTMAEDSLASAAATDPEPVFRTECLCQWVTGLVEGPFGEGAWEACEDPNGAIPDDAPVTFAVDVNWDRGSAFIGVCGVREDGRPQVEVAAGRPGGDWIEWVPEWFRGFVDADHPARVVVQAKGCPSASLVQPLSEVEGLEVVLWQGSDLAIGYGLFYDRVVAARGDASGLPPLAHRGQEALSLPARTASQRVFGDGWYWDRRNSPHNAAPLVAVTEALWDQLTNAPEAPSIFEEGPIDLF